jgi:hypothetical protein
MDVNSTDLTIKDYSTFPDRFYLEQVMFYMKKWLLFAKVPNQDDIKSVAKFIVPDLGDKVDSGKWLSNRPARLQPYAFVNYIPQSGTMYLDTV